MRRILVASLFLSTVLLPAQTVTQGQGATLVARNDSSAGSAVPDSMNAATDVTTAPAGRRISTGVTAPKLISEPNIHLAVADFPTADLATQHIVVSFRVDQFGVPQNVHLLKSAGQNVDERVLTAVRGYRFEPAQLDDQAVSMNMNLVVNFATR
jgi:TonB family protein